MPGPRPQPRFCRRRRRWYVHLRGRQYILGPDEGTAYERFGRLYRQIFGDDATHGGPPNSVVKLVDAWLLAHPSPWHRSILRDFARFAIGVSLADLPADLLERYARSLAGSPQTVRHKVRYATRILRWGHDRELIARIPRPPKLPRVPVGHRDIPQAQIPAVLAALDRPSRHHVLHLVRFVLLTACRPGEARTLRWRDVDLAERVCRLSKHKTAHRTGTDRVIYLPPAAVELLGSLHRGGPSSLVFPSIGGRLITKDALARALKRWCGIRPNQLRHTAAQHMLDQVRREDVAKLLGHRTTRSVDTYAQVRDARARKVAESITPIPSVAIPPGPQTPGPDEQRAAQ